MKILHLTKKYPEAIGGDAVVVSHLEKEQLKRGHEVFILTSNCPEIKEQENVFKFGLKDIPSDLDRITVRRLIALIILLIGGFKYLKRVKPDVIHTHSADLGFFISISARLYHIPVVNTCHGVTFPDKQYSVIKRFAELFCLKHSGFKKIIAVDKSSLKDFEAAKIKNGIYIPNGVDIERFNCNKSGIKNGKIRFLFVGRLEEQKGCKYLIRATKMLLEKTNNFQVLVVGDGSQRAMLTNLAKENKLIGCVSVLGGVNDDELNELYCTSDAFVLPSLWEGMPLTLLEAWAAKLPVIVTNVGGIRDVCVDTWNGLVVMPEDPESIAEAMFRLIEDAELRSRLGANGKAQVKSNFSWDKVVMSTLRLYKEIIA